MHGEPLAQMQLCITPCFKEGLNNKPYRLAAQLGKNMPLVGKCC